MTVHNFGKSLELSEQHADASWWIEVYWKAFPDLVSAVSVRKDGWAQRGGIDRVLTLESGKTLTVDEKVRDADWPDILLEYWSDRDRRTKGWVAKDLACDFIAYAFVPSETCYLIPFQTLRRAWRENCFQWVKAFKKVEAENKFNGNEWVTVSVAVPIDIFFSAMNDAMKIQWGEK